MTHFCVLCYMAKVKVIRKGTPSKMHEHVVKVHNKPDDYDPKNKSKLGDPSIDWATFYIGTVDERFMDNTTGKTQNYVP